MAVVSGILTMAEVRRADRLRAKERGIHFMIAGCELVARGMG